MEWRRLGWSGLAALILVGGVVWWRRHFRETVQRASEVTARATSDLLGPEPESIPDAAVYKRYRHRRDAVDSMRMTLRLLAIAESAYQYDSVRPTTNLGTNLRPLGGVVGPTIMLTRDGWWAWVSHVNVSMTCKIFMGSPPDTSFGNAKPGEPVCKGEHAGSWP